MCLLIVLSSVSQKEECVGISGQRWVDHQGEGFYSTFFVCRRGLVLSLFLPADGDLSQGLSQ